MSRQDGRFGSAPLRLGTIRKAGTAAPWPDFTPPGHAAPTWRLLYLSPMEERIIRPATSFGSAEQNDQPKRFERPAAQEISLCCEISAYAPDGDDTPLF